MVAVVCLLACSSPTASNGEPPSGAVLFEVTAISLTSRSPIATLVETSHSDNESTVMIRSTAAPDDALGRSIGEYCLIEELRRVRSYPYVAKSSSVGDSVGRGASGLVNIRFTSNAQDELDWFKRMRERDALLRSKSQAGVCGKVEFAVLQREQ